MGRIYQLKLLNELDFYEFFQRENDRVFATTYFDPREAGLYSKEELALLEDLKPRWQQRYKILVGAYCGDELVGWSENVQVRGDELRMHVSAVVEAHRGKGLYSKMLKLVMREAEKAGFQRITSYHHVTNNAVLVPKLKAGFTIQGIEVRDDAGVMVKLVYYPNGTRRALLKVRSGERRPSVREGAILGFDGKRFK